MRDHDQGQAREFRHRSLLVAALLHHIGEVVARIAVGRVEIAGMIALRLRYRALDAAPEVAIPFVFFAVVIELHGVDDRVPDIGIAGARLGAFDEGEHRPFMGMVALSAVFGPPLFWSHGAIDRDLFGTWRHAAFQLVKPVFLAPQRIGRIGQRQLRRFRDDPGDLVDRLLCHLTHAPLSPSHAGGFEAKLVD